MFDPYRTSFEAEKTVSLFVSSTIFTLEIFHPFRLGLYALMSVPLPVGFHFQS